MLYSGSSLVCSLQSRPSSYNIIHNLTTSVPRTWTVVFLLSYLSFSSVSLKIVHGCASPNFRHLFGVDQKKNNCHPTHHSSLSPTTNTMSNETSDKRSKCIFCKICDDTTKEGTEKLLHSDDNLVVFRDIHPAAKHHYLVVPREHIPTVKSLTKEQKPFLEKMISLAKQTLEKEGADMSDIRLGFHWPPFQSIEHLHLHAISPTREMSYVKRIIFKENSWWFASSDYVLNRLASE